MSWYAIKVKRDKPGFMKTFERPIVDHLVDDLNKLERETGGRVMALIVVADTIYDMEVAVQIEPNPNHI